MKTEKLSRANMQVKLSGVEMKALLGGDEVKDYLKNGARCSSNSACCSKVCLNADGESGKSKCKA
jgi:hypothetical protein